MGSSSTPIRNTPLLNRAIQAQLAPGSVFKIVMATAMLESKAVPANYNGFLSRLRAILRTRFHCWDGKGAWHSRSAQGHRDSCDVFFYNVGKRLGIDKHSYYGSGLGLGKHTGIDLPGEESGPDAFGRMGAARLPPQVVSGRNDFRCHRPGRGDRHAAATRAHDCRRSPTAATSSSRT